MATEMPRPFLRVELCGVAMGEGERDGKIVLTRQTPESTQIKIETTHKVIYCPADAVRAALDTITGIEAEQLEGN